MSSTETRIRVTWRSAFLASAVGMVVAGVAAAGTIPPEQLDQKKVFWGSAANFQKPAALDFQQVIMATPEYGQIKQKKVEKGTGQFWVLMSQASERALHAIAQVGQEVKYDLITALGYLGGLNPPIQAEDITKSVIAKLSTAGNAVGSSKAGVAPKTGISPKSDAGAKESRIPGRKAKRSESEKSSS